MEPGEELPEASFQVEDSAQETLLNKSIRSRLRTASSTGTPCNKATSSAGSPMGTCARSSSVASSQRGSAASGSSASAPSSPQRQGEYSHLPEFCDINVDQLQVAVADRGQGEHRTAHRREGLSGPVAGPHTAGFLLHDTKVAAGSREEQAHADDHRG